MINISEKIFVGFHKSSNPAKLPTSSIAPVGATAGEKKKLEKIRQSTTIQHEFDNIPLPGFTLTTAGRRGWQSSETVWTVIDPRGFTSTMTSENLEHILHCTGITEGLIQEKCVWARHNDQISMILIPISSEMYITAVENTTALANKVSLKDVNLGDVVNLQNGLTGVYLGSASLYSAAAIGYESPDIVPDSVIKRQIIQVTPTLYYYQSDLKVLSVVERCKDPFTKEEVLSLLNKSIRDKHVFTSSEYTVLNPSKVYRDNLRYASHTNVKINDVKYSVEEVSLADAHELFDLGKNCFDITTLMLVSATGEQYLVGHPRSLYTSAGSTMTYSSFETIRVEHYNSSIQLHSSVYKAKPSGYRLSRTPDHKFDMTRYNLSDFSHYYKIIKHIKTNSYV